MTEDTTPRRVEQMDLSQPFWLTFDQTDAKRYTVPHPTEQEARQYAQERAVATGRQIAVFGPQADVYAVQPRSAAPVELLFKKPAVQSSPMEMPTMIEQPPSTKPVQYEELGDGEPRPVLGLKLGGDS